VCKIEVEMDEKYPVEFYKKLKRKNLEATTSKLAIKII